MRLTGSLIVLLLALTHLAQAAPFAIPDTDVLKLRSHATGQDYEIRVAAPPGYAKSGKTYATIYMLDADYSFSLVRNIVQHFVERENLPPMILVGIAYPGAAADRSIYRTSRTRDYTPSFVADGGYGPEFQRYSGGASKFADFIALELMPLIAERYPVERMQELERKQVSEREARAEKARRQAEAGIQRYVIDVATYVDETEATEQLVTLIDAGYDGSLSSRESNGRVVFTIQVGPFEDLWEAEQAAQTLDEAYGFESTVALQRREEP